MSKTKIIELKEEDGPVDDWIETYSSEVFDTGIIIKEAAENVVEALRSGKPVNLKEIDDIQHSIEELRGSLRQLEDELKRLP